MKTSIWPLRAALVSLTMFSFATQMAIAVPPPAGIAPVGPPSGGFALDGDVAANTPANVGDWILCPPPPAGTGTGVLDKFGVPLNPNTTIHVNDPYGNMGTDMVFVGGLKWFDNPNTWNWTTGKCSSKTDINNAMLHITSDAQGHVWAIVSGDRASTSGDSYIDFEFLQNSLTRTTGGGFSSAGTNAGRTTNDLLLSLAFTGGGKVADFYAWRWQPSGSSFAYADATAALPAGRVFVALNDVATAVPYGAFGETNYERNAFVEGAVDLTALLGNFDPCMSLSVRTILIKTKASQSNTATIEDFVDPIQFSLTIGPSTQAGPDQTRCSEGASTAFTLQGAATSGTLPINSTMWTVVAGSATIDAPTSLSTVVHVTSPSATLRLSGTQNSGCTVSDDVVLRVTPLPGCLITGPATNLCPANAVTFNGPPGLTSYAWTIAGNGTISGSTTQQTVTVLTGPNCGSSLSLGLTVAANNCSSTCAAEFMVNDLAPPILTRPSDLVLDCPADTRTNVTGVATAVDECGSVAIRYSDVTLPGCGGSATISRTWTATDRCGNVASAVQTITLRDRMAPVLTLPPNATLECPADPLPALTGTATAVDVCSSATVTFSDVVAAQCGGTRTIARTWTAMDACGNQAQGVQTIQIVDRTAPFLTIPSNRFLECPANVSTAANGTATATDACGQATVRYSDSVSNECGGTKIIRRTWTATDDCGNATNAVQTLTVRDTVAPMLTIPLSRILECPADTGTNANGVAMASDGCGTVVVSYSDSVSNRCGNTLVLTRTWTAIDQCGNTTNAAQLITVQDRKAPMLLLPPNAVVECPGDFRTNATGVATAQDGCSQAVVTWNDVVTIKCGSTRIIARTWTASDSCGNTTNAVQTITVRDSTPPQITAPLSVVLECPANTQPSATGTAVAQDGCSQATVTYSDATTTPCGGTKVITRTWIATDECGNRATAVQTITVQDTRPPTISGPPDRLLECPADTRPSATGTATAQDGCSQAAVTYSDSVSNLCGGSKVITRTWTATDACGNVARTVQTIRVQDTTAPMIQCALVNTYSQGGYGGSGTPAAILEANYLSHFPNGLLAGVYNTSGGNAAPNGLWWQGNANGLAALRQFLSGGGGSSSFISRDAMNPVDDFGGGELAHQAVTLILNIRFNETGVIGIGPNNFGSLVYTRAGDPLSGLTVSQILAVAQQALAGQSAPNFGSASSLTKLLDDLNHAFHEYSISSFAMSYLDTPSMVVQCASAVPAPDASRVRASDDCGGPVTIAHAGDVITDESCPNRYTMVRTWSATDGCGNRSTCSYQIIVNDTTPPMLIGNTERTLAYGQPLTFELPVASDNCGQVTLSVLSTVTNLASEFVLVATRVWEAADECGNTNIFQQTVTVGGSANSNSVPVVQNTFETGDEGWRVGSGTTDEAPLYSPVGGQSGGYVNATSATGGGPRYWTAPGKYRGNRLGFYGGVFSFACKRSGSASLVILQGSGLTLELNLPHPGTNWTTCNVRLHESAGWKNRGANRAATQAELIMTLNSLTNILITAEAGADGSPGGLDNVALITPASAPTSGWVLDSLPVVGGRLKLRWPTLATDHRLEQTDNLRTPNWTSVTTAPVVSNGLNQTDVTPAGTSKFYRLRKVSNP